MQSSDRCLSPYSGCVCVMSSFEQQATDSQQIFHAHPEIVAWLRESCIWRLRPPQTGVQVTCLRFGHLGRSVSFVSLVYIIGTNAPQTSVEFATPVSPQAGFSVPVLRKPIFLASPCRHTAWLAN